MDWVAGCAAGAAGIVACQPFDTVKVRLQTMPLTGAQYRSMGACAAAIVRQESVTGLYKGMLSPLLGCSALYAVLFGVQQAALARLDHSPGSHALAGLVSGTAQSLLGAPLELSKIRLQIQGMGVNYRHSGSYSKRYSNSVSCLFKVVREEGVAGGLFRGLPITVLRDAPSFALYFYMYESLCNWSLAPGNRPRSELSLLWSGLFGGVVGCVAWFSIYPIDTVKSELQANSALSHRAIINQIYRSAGVAGFYRGVVPCMLRAASQNSVVFVTVELIRKLAPCVPSGA